MIEGESCFKKKKKGEQGKRNEEWLAVLNRVGGRPR